MIASMEDLAADRERGKVQGPLAAEVHDRGGRVLQQRGEASRSASIGLLAIATCGWVPLSNALSRTRASPATERSCGLSSTESSVIPIGASRPSRVQRRVFDQLQRAPAASEPTEASR